MGVSFFPSDIKSNENVELIEFIKRIGSTFAKHKSLMRTVAIMHNGLNRCRSQ